MPRMTPRVGSALCSLCSVFVCALALCSPASAKSAQYMRPPESIARALETPARPLAILNPTRDCIALLARPGMPTIAELAQPGLVLAGERIDPRNNGPSRYVAASAITFRRLPGGTARTVTLPGGAKIIAPLWSPDGRQLAFLLVRDTEIDLWVATDATGTARPVAKHVNATFGRPFEWLPDSSGLIVRLIPSRRGAPPEPSDVPSGPVVQDSSKLRGPAHSVRNPLRTPYDDSLFAYYFTSQLTLVASTGGSARPIGAPAIISHMSISPDGRYILEKRLTRPFSRVLPAHDFAAQIIVSDRHGRIVHEVASRSANDLMANARIVTGPRSVAWRADAPATLVWAEAQTASTPRDKVFMLHAPFASKPALLLDWSGRYVKTLWGRDDLALVVARRSHRRVLVAVNPSDPGHGRVMGARRRRVGFPVMHANKRGRSLLQFTADGNGIFLVGASRSSLARLDLRSGAVTRVWRDSAPDHRVRLDALLDSSGQRLLLWRQSATQPPNLFVLDRTAGSARRVTDFKDPAPQLAGIQRRFIAYDRDDGVHLGGTLYLPSGYDASRDGPLPMLMWGYPRSYRSSAAVGPGGGASDVFVRPRGVDPPLLLLTQGFAIFEPRMPIVGSDGKAPNDTYVAQLVADARAAVDAVVRRGVADRRHIAIGGHSYGAAMAANLLAWTDLFRAGIAMSGAYNRTLTPYGFQTERRTLWEAPATYLAMSSFLHADRINEPLLIIEGGDDPKSSTTPMQSQRLFDAIRSLGGTVRYVLLPDEGHAYEARQSVMDVYWEIDRWLKRHIGRDAQ